MAPVSKRPAWRDHVCLYLFLGVFLILIVLTFVSTLLNGNRIDELSWDKRDDLDSCTWRKKEKDQILGDGQSLFGTTGELEAFFSDKPKYDRMVKLMYNLCASKACRKNEDCANHVCPLLSNIVASIDNSSSSSSGSGGGSDTDGKIYSKDLGSKTSGDGSQCELSRLQQPFWPYLSQNIFVCTSPPDVQALIYRCLPLFVQVCYYAKSDDVRAFCQAVMGAYSQDDPPWGAP